ncbi:MAG: formyltransferase family protein [candidate division WOR-3 bacterium]
METGMRNVVVFSPSRFSLYTIAVAEMLLRQGVDVKAIFVRRLLNPARFLGEFQRDGRRLMRKVWRKLLLREKAYPIAKEETIVHFLKKEGILLRDVEEFRKRYGIPIVYCSDLNDPSVVATLQTIKPALGVFTGGGLIREAVLAHCGMGILNCHSGMLPRYRGMDVIEWAILEGRFQEVGMTVHFMDRGVDTGDLLRLRRVDLRPGEDIRRLRDRFEPLMCQEIVAACLDVLAGRAQRTPQRLEDGKQYFVMHPQLIRLAEARLKAIHA